MIRLLGVTLWVGAVLWLLISLTEKERKKNKIMRSLLLLLRYTRSEMACFAKPLPEIFAAFRDKTLEEVGFLPLLREQGMACATAHLMKEGLLAAEDAVPLSEWADTLGKRFLTEELPALDRAITAWQALTEQKQQEAPRRQKLTGTVLLSGGALILLLLW